MRRRRLGHATRRGDAQGCSREQAPSMHGAAAKFQRWPPRKSEMASRSPPICASAPTIPSGSPGPWGRTLAQGCMQARCGELGACCHASARGRTTSIGQVLAERAGNWPYVCLELLEAEGYVM